MPKIESSGVIEVKLTRQPFNEMDKETLREYLARLRGIREMQAQTAAGAASHKAKTPAAPIKFNEDEII